MNLRYWTDLRNHDPRHPQTVMRELGITYREAIPQSLGEQWWFLGCENVPAYLPVYIQELKEIARC